MSPPRLAAYCTSEAEAVTARLFEWLAIPSISAAPEHAEEVYRSAEWLADACRDAGFDRVEIWSTPGHPSVFAEWT
ncbi:MAG TPA: hypothetical protein VFN21_08770, partial [Acidimicrobiales bacterium]|nr:hypothetical protein [Acidimicrobiales bacterium]